MPEGAGPSSSASGGDGDAIWLDLVARFNAPVGDDAEPPWPDREDLAGPLHAAPPAVPEALPQEPPTNPGGITGLSPFPGILDERALEGRGLDDHGGSGLGDSVPDRPGRHDAGLADTGLADTGLAGTGLADTGTAGAGLAGAGPDLARPGDGSGYRPRHWAPPRDPEDEHYIPPVPPPLPKIHPVTALAWLALLGGPLYLLIGTANGAPISAFAAFLSVAVFVGGFVVILLRMDNGRPPDSGSGDDGAVV